VSTMAHSLVWKLGSSRGGAHGAASNARHGLSKHLDIYFVQVFVFCVLVLYFTLRFVICVLRFHFCASRSFRACYCMRQTIT